MTKNASIFEVFYEIHFIWNSGKQEVIFYKFYIILNEVVKMYMPVIEVRLLLLKYPSCAPAGNRKSSKISIWAIIKQPQTLRFVPRHLKTKKICKHAIKKFPFVIRYVPDRYKAQKMCDKDSLENGETLESVPNFYKNQKQCNKAVDN